MKELNISALYQYKEGGKYIDGRKDEGTNIHSINYIHEMLMHDLIAKKLHNAGYIKKITNRCLHNGYYEIIVYYKDINCDSRRIYIVDHR